MSYILNALKQSENQRSLGDIPHVDTQQEIAGTSDRPAPGRGLWRWWALLASSALLLLLAWVVAGKLATPADTPLLASAPPQPVSASPAPVVDNLTPPAAELTSLDPPPAAILAPGLEHLQDASGLRVQLDDAEPARAPVVLELPVAAGRVAAPTPSAPTVLATAPSRTPEIPQRRDDDESTPADPRLRDVAHWKGLPSGVQRQLREMGINAHVYSSDASARFIRAGGRTLREGDRLNAELRLQFITREGIVLGYQDRKYWMRLN